MPRWLLAIVAGLTSAALLIAVTLLGFGLEFELAVFLGGALGLCVASLVARWFPRRRDRV